MRDFLCQEKANFDANFLQKGVCLKHCCNAAKGDKPCANNGNCRGRKPASGDVKATVCHFNNAIKYAQDNLAVKPHKPAQKVCNWRKNVRLIEKFNHHKKD